MKFNWSNATDVFNLLSSNRHSIEVLDERRRLIMSRVRLGAAILSVLTVGWIIIDAMTLSWPVWGVLALERVGAAAAFLILMFRSDWGTPKATVAVFFLIPVVFLLSAQIALQEFTFTEEAIFVSTAYSYASFLLAAGLSVFPLTAVEAIVVGLPVLVLALVSLLWSPQLFASAPATMLRLSLILGIAAIAGMGQLRLLIALTEQSTRDRLTGALTRRAGEDRIKSCFRIARESQSPLSLVFFDLDNFKSINDRFGHDGGDSVLKSTARSISRCLMRHGCLIRWGGEEFVALLPQTELTAAREVIKQIGSEGLGASPDGSAVTASIGVAECFADMAHDPEHLIRLADERMYAAKAAGRNCYVCGVGEPARFMGAASACCKRPSVGGPAVQRAGV